MKHVRESLKQFENYQFFQLFEKEVSTDKESLKDKEAEGLKVIDKITKNFDDFKKSAKGEITKYKEFWEENQKAKKAFTETGSTYKMFDDDYVIGVLELPAETLSDGSIDGGMGATDEPEEEIIEGKELGGEEEVTESDDVSPMMEAEEGEDDLGLDLGAPEKDATSMDAQGPAFDFDIPDEPLEGGAPAEKPVETPEETPEVPEETPEVPETPAAEEKPDLTAPQTYFVVYDISGDEREEIFRCGSNNVVSAFNTFYNDAFKGSMKDIILKYKEQKEKDKKDAEKTEKESAEKSKNSKLQKFLGESLNEDTIADIENNMYDPGNEDDDLEQWLQEVAEYLTTEFEIEDEDLEKFMDIVMDKLEELHEDGTDSYEAASIVAEDEEAWEEFENSEDYVEVEELEDVENEEELEDVENEEELEDDGEFEDEEFPEENIDNDFPEDEEDELINRIK